MKRLAPKAKVICAREESTKERVRRCHIMGTEEVERACVKSNKFHREPDESYDSMT
jgi:hypothetical protein